jgi:hypothetical protein
LSDAALIGYFVALTAASIIVLARLAWTSRLHGRDAAIA